MADLNNIRTIAIGAVGGMTSLGAENLEQITAIDISEGASLITQLVILIATLLGLFKKKRINNNLN